MSETNLLKSLDYSILQQCMHCGMCLPTCPTYDETKFERSSPRGRIRLMREVADGRLEVSERFAEEMSYCLGCLACQTACPAGVDYATLFENARGEIERQRVASGPWRRFIRWITLSVLFRHPRLLRAFGRVMWLYQKLGIQAAIRALGVPRILPKRLRRLESMTPTVNAPFSNKRIAPHERPMRPSLSQARNPQLVDAGPHGTTYRVALLTGCVQDLLYAHINRATADVLLANGCEVIAPPEQYCCGSLHAHNGELELARDLARKNLDLYDLTQLDAVISNAGGCGSHLKKYGELLHDDAEYRDRAHEWDAKVFDIHEWLVKIGLRAPRLPGSREEPATTVTYDASCHLLHGQRVAVEPLQLLQAIPDIRLVPLAESDWCCGAAGVYTITQPEQSAKLLARKLDHIAVTGASVVASGNPGCLLQLEMGMRRDPRLAGIRTCHPVELLAEAYRRESP